MSDQLFESFSFSAPFTVTRTDETISTFCASGLATAAATSAICVELRKHRQRTMEDDILATLKRRFGEINAARYFCQVFEEFRHAHVISTLMSIVQSSSADNKNLQDSPSFVDCS